VIGPWLIDGASVLASACFIAIIETSSSLCPWFIAKGLFILIALLTYQ
jgi:hypothetical protein